MISWFIVGSKVEPLGGAHGRCTRRFLQLWDVAGAVNSRAGESRGRSGHNIKFNFYIHLFKITNLLKF